MSQVIWSRCYSIKENKDACSIGLIMKVFVGQGSFKLLYNGGNCFEKSLEMMDIT